MFGPVGNRKKTLMNKLCGFNSSTKEDGLSCKRDIEQCRTADESNFRRNKF